MKVTKNKKTGVESKKSTPKNKKSEVKTEITVEPMNEIKFEESNKLQEIVVKDISQKIDENNILFNGIWTRRDVQIYPVNKKTDFKFANEEEEREYFENFAPTRFRATLDGKRQTYAVNFTDDPLGIFSDNYEESQQNLITHDTNKRYLEKVTGLNLDISYVPNRSHSTWDTQFIDLKRDSVNYIDLTNPFNRIKFSFLKMDTRIASSKEEAKENSLFQFYIHDENKTKEQVLKKHELLSFIYNKSKDLNIETKRSLINLVKDITYTSNDRIDIEAMYSELIENNTNKLSRFLSFTPDKINTLSIIRFWIGKNTIRHNIVDNAYYIGDTKLGDTEEQVADTLLLPSNQEYLLQLKRS